MKKALRYALPLLGTAAILTWIFSSIPVEPKALWAWFIRGHLGWLAVAVGATGIAFWLRAYRWWLLLRATGAKLSIADSFWALMGGYLANFVIPRLGEAFRCSVLKRRQGIPLAQGLGTVLGERLIDVVCIVLVVGVSLLLERVLLWQLLQRVAMSDSLERVLRYSWVVVLVVGCAYLWIQRYKKAWLLRVWAFLVLCWKSFLSVGKIRPLVPFYAITCLMWLAYYVTNYAFMEAYTATAGLPMRTGLLLLVTSSLGMLVPVQSGIGSYHAFVLGTFVWYGVSKSDGLAMALLIHFVYSVLAIMFGAVAVALFFSHKRSGHRT